MSHSSRSLLSLAILLVVIGCSPTPEDLIVGTWQAESYVGRKTGGEWARFSLSDCLEDDRLEYGDDGTWKRYRGSRLCENQRNGETPEGRWRVVGGGAALMETEEGYLGEYESVIEELSETTLVVRLATGVVPESSYPDELRSTWKRID